ncbi:acylphosphatase-2-like [Argiope bruennichi]|uniref:acylphosphatase n=1 Tax=Argiope bruennichi TaxID=94029 RepID=A0A8T0F087_ARGBR|nr:acylphosphatase-2-like [Argiope bruennichi]KAF8784544.1 Acylphosphatase-2 like protein [Argiope bruennichi]
MTAVVQPQQQRNGGPVLVHVEFEVFGGVQGVHFAKYCKEMCDRFDLKGWTKPSAYGTIQGVIQGEKAMVDEMAMWLQHQGAPGSRIDHCDLRNWQIVDRCDYRRFNVRY